MSTSIKGYDVFCNGTYIGFVRGCNKQSRLLGANKAIGLNTHMRGWVCTDGSQGRIYTCATTIGRYVRFEPCKRLAATIGQYLIE